MPSVKPSQLATAIAATRLPQPATPRSLGRSRRLGQNGITVPRRGPPPSTSAEARAITAPGTASSRSARAASAARRRNIGGRHRIVASHSATRSRSSGIETPVRDAGEVEIALYLSRVLGHVDHPAAPPQRRIGQPRRGSRLVSSPRIYPNFPHTLFYDGRNDNIPQLIGAYPYGKSALK